MLKTILCVKIFFKCLVPKIQTGPLNSPLAMPLIKIALYLKIRFYLFHLFVIIFRTRTVICILFLLCGKLNTWYQNKINPKTRTKIVAPKTLDLENPWY